MTTRFHHLPGVRVHTHPQNPGVTMQTDRSDHMVVIVSEEYGRSFTAYYSRKYAAHLLKFWRASR